MGKSAAEMLTGDKGPAVRLNVLLPELEYRYLYSLLVDHDKPVSETGRKMVERLTQIMGDRIDDLNKYGK